MAEEIPTFCRVCEPSCGLVARVENGEMVSLRPDRDHPVTGGFACNKGIAGLDIHRDPDIRLGLLALRETHRLRPERHPDLDPDLDNHPDLCSRLGLLRCKGRHHCL